MNFNGFNKSTSIATELKKVIASGTNSPGRLGNDVKTPTLIIEKAYGSMIEDVDGNQYVDFLMGLGPNILGHSPKQVCDAIAIQAERGLVYGLNNSLELELANRIVDACDYVQELRFTCSGTEAVMTSLRVARAYTGRSKVLKFKGGYHGHADSLLTHSSKSTVRLNPNSVKDGIPDLVRANTIISNYNDSQMTYDIISENADNLAAVIIEPVATNMGLVPANTEFLKMLRELCTKHDIVLIFDEVVSGFRFNYGAVSNELGIIPDLTTFGKIIGGGLAIGAYGGRKDLMEEVGHKGGVFQGGSFAGNPLTMAAGIATLDVLSLNGFYERIASLAEHFMDVTLKGFEERNINFSIQRRGSLATYIFNEKVNQLTSFEDVLLQNNELFSQFHLEMAQKGYLFAPTIEEPIFFGAAHTIKQVENAASTAVDVLSNLLKRGDF